MKHRSIGVTVVAVLLILAGGIGACGSLLSVAVGGGPIERLEQQIDQQLDRVPVGTDQGQVPPERMTDLRNDLKRRFSELRGVIESPAVRFGSLAQGLLALVAMIGGCGLLARSGWAPKVVIGQAGLSILLGLWWLAFSPMTSVQKEMHVLVLDLAGGAIPLSVQLQMRQSMEMAQAIGQWVGGLFIVGWNGFLIWFVNRAR